MTPIRYSRHTLHVAGTVLATFLLLILAARLDWLLVILSVLVLVFGFGATIAAFGGPTWVKGSAPLQLRILPRGWLSLACLLAALLSGIGKEVIQYNTYEHKDQVIAHTANQVDQLQADNQSLRAQIISLKDQLAVAIEKAKEALKTHVDQRQLYIEPEFPDGKYFNLINTTKGEIRNLRSDYIVTINLWLSLKDGYEGGAYGTTLYSKSPGVPVFISDGEVLFSLDVDSIHQSLNAAIEELKPFLNLEREQKISLTTSVKLEYDDAFGKSYRHFLSLRVFSEQPLMGRNMHDNAQLYQDDMRWLKNTLGKERMELRQWNLDGKSGLAAKIKSFIRE